MSMRLQQEPEKSEQWRSDASVADRQEIEENLTHSAQSAVITHTQPTYSDKPSMIRAIVTMVTIRLLFLASFTPLTIDLMMYFYTHGYQNISGWVNAVGLVCNTGVVILIGWIDATIAPRRIVPAIAYGSGISYLLSLAYYFLWNRMGGIPIHFSLRMRAEGIFWAITIAVTEIVIALWFARRFAQK